MGVYRNHSQSEAAQFLFWNICFDDLVSLQCAAAAITVNQGQLYSNETINNLSNTRNLIPAYEGAKGVNEVLGPPSLGPPPFLADGTLMGR